MKHLFKNLRSLILFFCDIFVVLFSYIFATIVCSTDRNIPSLLIALPIYAIACVCFGMYKSIWRYAKAREFLLCIGASLTGGILFAVTDKIRFNEHAPKVYFYVVFITLVILSTVSMRLIYRIFRQYYYKNNAQRKRKRALFVGAGQAAVMLVDESIGNSYCDFEPVVMVDDDVTKVGRTIGGIKVAGTVDDIPAIADKYQVELIVITIPSATNKERGYILDICSHCECAVRILPMISDFTNSDMYNITAKLREITPDELLGRDTIEVANEEVLNFVKNKTVLVTGGGGSIGSELCRQIAAHYPKKLIIVDIYENNAYEIEQELIRKYGDSLNLLVLIASVRDFVRLDEIFTKEKPDIVLHAAAHKHVPLMETSPEEAIKNNVFGTLNTAKAAMANGVSKFILISTDKAVNPTNIMGASKRMCEMIVQSMNGKSDTIFAAVRFGNVLGSNGSVIPLFKKQIAEGGPVTVTHQDIIRYFMTIPEAAQLVLTAGAMANGGEIFILDMGEPVKIDDLARKMIKLSGLTPGEDIEIEYTGLRPGEKLYEELLMNEEGKKTTANKKIFIGRQIDIDEEEFYKKLDILRSLSQVKNIDIVAIQNEIKDIVPTFKHNYGTAGNERSNGHDNNDSVKTGA